MEGFETKQTALCFLLDREIRVANGIGQPIFVLHVNCFHSLGLAESSTRAQWPTLASLSVGSRPVWITYKKRERAKVHRAYFKESLSDQMDSCVHVFVVIQAATKSLINTHTSATCLHPSVTALSYPSSYPYPLPPSRAYTETHLQGTEKCFPLSEVCTLSEV